MMQFEALITFYTGNEYDINEVDRRVRASSADEIYEKVKHCVDRMKSFHNSTVLYSVSFYLVDDNGKVCF